MVVGIGVGMKAASDALCLVGAGLTDSGNTQLQNYVTRVDSWSEETDMVKLNLCTCASVGVLLVS